MEQLCRNTVLFFKDVFGEVCIINVCMTAFKKTSNFKIWCNWFVIYSQNEMVCDSFSVTGMWQKNNMNMTSGVNYTDVFFSFLTGVTRNFSTNLSKFGVFIRNWSACFEKVSFLYAGFTVLVASFCSNLNHLISDQSTPPPPPRISSNF